MIQHLQYRGFDAALVTPEEYELSLRACTERINTWCPILFFKDYLLIRDFIGNFAKITE